MRGQNFLVDIENLQKVSELSTPKFFHGSKPHSWVRSVLSIITNAMVPVLCIWWVKTTVGWFFRFWNEPGWETFLNVYWRLPVPLNLVLVFYFNIALFFYILLLMGGGVAGVVSCGVCLTAWLKAEL